MEDIQNRKPSFAFKLTRVGCSGIRKPVIVRRGNNVNYHLVCVFNVFIDLPSTVKGSHMSRDTEAINEVVDRSVREPVEGIENLCAMIAKTLLDKHEYASYAEANAETEYFLERRTPTGVRSLECYKLLGRAYLHRGNTVRKSIGVQVTGMNVCPCAAETIKTMKGKKSLISHNQRNVSTLIIELSDGYDVDATDLVEIVESSFSAPTYEILKRKDEAEVVIAAHKNPKFVEDIVRTILSKVVEKYSYLPDDTYIIAGSESEESIHKHNAFAERITTLGELKKPPP